MFNVVTDDEDDVPKSPVRNINSGHITRFKNKLLQKIEKSPPHKEQIGKKRHAGKYALHFLEQEP